ncbi:MDR family MFS transporter [Sporolactobacillus laevolacticus]|uniref:MFS transporter n=1 Tax=Sporolactobacillus laevolacticus DSM 442 TaxID=1395513 RepID=V6J027_9BACL|nr:MFS transporter [Sporolactobacillus laevolacticus]EST12501.1 MFS transporter [Sporolactobacillus laevolacticus DSM 442]
MNVLKWDHNLQIRLVGEALFNLFFWMYFPFITVYFSHALGNSIAGMLMMVPPIMSTFGNLIGGGLADRVGRRPIMLLGAIIQTVMFVSLALSPSIWLDYFSFMGISLGTALYSPPSAAMVADLTPEKERRQVFATFTTANNIGAVLGPALGAILFFHYKSELLWTCAIVLLTYSVVIFFKIHETKPAVTDEKSDAPLTRQLFRGLWTKFSIIFTDRVFGLYILAGVFAIITIMQLDLHLAVYVMNHVPAQPLIAWNHWSFKLSSSEVFGWLLGLNGLMFVVLVLPISSWLKNWRERNILLLSCFLSGVGTFAVGLNSNIWYLFFVTIIFTLGEIVRSPVTQSFVSNYAPEHSRGLYLGASNLQFTIGRFLAPISVFLSAWVPPMGIFSILLFFALVGMSLYYYLFKIYAVN